MDFKKLAATLLSSDSVSGLSNLSGASSSDVKKVLAQALPTLLNGANNQAKDKDTSASFVNALSQHGKADTKDLSQFLGKVDMKDGAKIIAHLLGSNKDDVVQNISNETGVSQKKTDSILSAIAPLLMSLLGQQTAQEENDSPIEGLVGALLENVDMGDMLMGLLGSDSDDDDDKDDKKKKKKKEADSGNLLSGLMNLLK